MKKLLIFLLGFSGLCLRAQVLPTASFSIPSADICLNQTLMCTNYSTNNPTNYVWYSSGAGVMNQGSPFAVLTFTSLGTHTIYLTVSNSAGTSTNSATQTIVVNPLPQVSGTATPSLIGQFSSSTLSASGGVSYTWQPVLFGGIAYQPTASPTMQVYSNHLAGQFTFTVQGSDTKGCIGTGTAQLRVVIVGGIEKTEIFPLLVQSENPFNKRFHIKLHSPAQMRYALYDVNLKQLMIGEFDEELNLNTTSLLPGLYLLKLRTEKEETTIRLIKSE
jgi:hypothetical protein